MTDQGQRDADYLNDLFRQLLASLVVTVDPGQDPGIRGEIFHQGGGNLGKVRGAPGAGDVLVLGPPQHGVHGVAHLVEQVVQRPGGQQGGAGPGGREEVQHEDNHRVLVRSVLLLPPSSDGEVTVLEGFSFPPVEVAVDVTQQVVRVSDCQLGDLAVPEFPLLGSLHHQLHPVDILEQLIETLRVETR